MLLVVRDMGRADKVPLSMTEAASLDFKYIAVLVCYSIPISGYLTGYYSVIRIGVNNRPRLTRNIKFAINCNFIAFLVYLW